jgi:hypothetical protein
MARSPRRLFAAPFVLTAVAASPALAGDHAPKVRFDGYQCYSGPKETESSVPCPESALPKPKKDTAVYKDGSDMCRIAGGKQVRCPPNITLPDPMNALGVEFDQYNLRCVTVEDTHCPEGATCNPPPPQPVACPDALLPHPMPKVKVKHKGKKCFIGKLQVACK